ncbi:sensor histidine kinase [Salipiger abyssi]|uniref:histidine kinase n=1 Tax=Salipiger abyssi TaxID=1250539 RepID=A0A1P8UYF9_9RHOB|nr:PhnD/SsuA/transferrin family substrate-binding protein [Salipiger abyssi]APZ54421.1 two-component system, LuxR family, sensor histidine kinase TtrS [Salipiger abyssi]
MPPLLRPFLLLLALAALPAAAEPERALKIGVLDFMGEDAALARWDATGTALNAALPEHRFELVALDIPALETALEAGALDFVITNPGHYAALEYRFHISRIATAETGDPVASTLVAKAPMAGIGALAGKRLAVVSPEAFGGFQVIWDEMVSVDAGLPGRVELVVTGFPMQRAADAVLAGEADAAVLRGCLLETLRSADPARYGPLHAVATRPAAETACAVSSAVYPGWPFAKAPGTSPGLAKQVAVALLSMQEGDLWTVPLDYQPVHDLLRRLRIGPYARNGPVSLSDFIADYRDWLIALAIALAFWALYSVRIETLVRRRTRALDAANAGLKREMAERRRAEEADRLHRRELEHVARLSILGEMASSIAHELNQPLSAISNYAQGLRMRLQTGNGAPEDLGRAAGEIAGQADRAALVIKRIRAFVRKRESQRAPVSLGTLLRETEALYEGVLRRAGVSADMQVEKDLPEVMADRVQLQQVLLNLVQNAVDAMEDTVPDERRITLRCARHTDPTRGPGICLSVRDRGCGLGPEALDRFAEAFYTTKPEGIGLGLALSRSIVEAHGGWMRAETPEQGDGLRVLVWLPERDET